MPIKLLILFLFLVSFSFASLEKDGVKVKVNTPSGRTKDIVVKRFIPEECKKIPIDNETLWTDHYANKLVPDACKSTYVHTKGKLLPMHLDEDLETFGELEVLVFIREMQTDGQLLLIDSRKKSWFDYRTIPGAINMPFHYFKERENYEFHFEHALQYMGVTKDKDGEFDFSKAKTLLLFCNGPWCSQSPTMIFALLDIGYPAEKLKWYRGGMQDWLSAGMVSTRP